MYTCSILVWAGRRCIVAPTSLTQRLFWRQVLAEELAGPVHALSLDTKAPSDLAKK